MVVAGHSQGSTVAAKMAIEYKQITHLIYSGGNPFGRMIGVIEEARAKDWCSPFVDLMRVIFIEKDKKNFQFNAYIGTEHNFFPLKSEGKPNYDIFNWDKVADDWLKWLNKN